MRVVVESNDQMRFSLHEITVPAECIEVEVTLKHSGVMPAKVMGHDWVLAKDSAMSAIVNAGLAAGAARGYLAANDKRVLAATKVVGGVKATPSNSAPTPFIERLRSRKRKTTNTPCRSSARPPPRGLGFAMPRLRRVRSPRK